MKKWDPIEWAIFICAVAWALSTIIDSVRGTPSKSGCGCFSHEVIEITTGDAGTKP